MALGRDELKKLLKEKGVKSLYGFSAFMPKTVKFKFGEIDLDVLRDRQSDVERAREWQGRPLESVYALIYMDAVFLRMRLEGHVRNVAVYTIVRINLDGQKECLGL